ncbi:MAG: aldo/keto reductase [Tepidiforma sp.]|nr:MAG: aldo/keto reductase [Tepidiforma sp.]
MEYRPLGRTGIRVSPLCLGAMMFGGKTAPGDAADIIDRAIDAGINFIDTANVYAQGRSEEAVGDALKRNGRRNDIVLATKVHGRVGEGPNAMGNTRRHIIEQCEASLRRLKTDWIDLYQVHRPQPDVPIDETLRALDDLVRSGKVRYIGTSTFAAWQLVESLWVSKEYGLERFVCEQPPYNLLDRRIERELLPMAQAYGFGIIPWSPLAGGLLTGKYSRNAPPPPDSRYANLDANPMYRRRMNDAIWDVIEPLEQLARDKGTTLSRLSLAWCMHQPGVTSPIIGPRTIEQLEDNLASLEVAITDEDREAIDQIIRPGTHVSPYHEADWRAGPFRW